MMAFFRAEKGKSSTLAYRYYIRSHLGHRNLDISLQEDACQIYSKNAAENLAALRHMVLNMMRSEKTRISVPVKQKRCLMNFAFLKQVLLAECALMVN